MSTIHYSDPLFEELLSRVPKDQMRTSSLTFGIASRIIEIMERKGWLQRRVEKPMLVIANGSEIKVLKA